MRSAPAKVDAAAVAAAADFVDRSSPVIAYWSMFGLLSFLMKLFFLVWFYCSIKDCFLFHCGWYEMKQCLVPCLLSSNTQTMVCFLWLNFGSILIIDEYDRNGVSENLILWRSVIWVVQRLCILLLLLVRSIWRRQKVGLTYLLSWEPQIFF